MSDIPVRTLDVLVERDAAGTSFTYSVFGPAGFVRLDFETGAFATFDGHRCDRLVELFIPSDDHPLHRALVHQLIGESARRLLESEALEQQVTAMDDTIPARVAFGRLALIETLRNDGVVADCDSPWWHLDAAAAGAVIRRFVDIELPVLDELRAFVTRLEDLGFDPDDDAAWRSSRVAGALRVALSDPQAQDSGIAAHLQSLITDLGTRLAPIPETRFGDRPVPPRTWERSQEIPLVWTSGRYPERFVAQTGYEEPVVHVLIDSSADLTDMWCRVTRQGTPLALAPLLRRADDDWSARLLVAVDHHEEMIVELVDDPHDDVMSPVARAAFLACQRGAGLDRQGRRGSGLWERGATCWRLINDELRMLEAEAEANATKMRSQRGDGVTSRQLRELGIPVPSGGIGRTAEPLLAELFHREQSATGAP